MLMIEIEKYIQEKHLTHAGLKVDVRVRRPTAA
jgi:hypothetical protein